MNNPTFSPHFNFSEPVRLLEVIKRLPFISYDLLVHGAKPDDEGPYESDDLSGLDDIANTDGEY